MNKVNDSENKDNKWIRCVNFYNTISNINPISDHTQYQPCFISYQPYIISYPISILFLIIPYINLISYHTQYQSYFISYPISTLFHIIPYINPISYHTQYQPISYYTQYEPYFISYPISTRDTHIRGMIGVSRVDIGYDMKIDIF